MFKPIFQNLKNESKYERDFYVMTSFGCSIKYKSVLKCIRVSCKLFLWLKMNKLMSVSSLSHP